MRYFFGVYGFPITREMQAGAFRLSPLTTSHAEAKNTAANTQNLNLTAIGEILGEPDIEKLFDLAGTLTFCQQQRVDVSQIISYEADASQDNLLERFPVSLRAYP